jgi:hypothetical protein
MNSFMVQWHELSIARRVDYCQTKLDLRLAVLPGELGFLKFKLLSLLQPNT